MMNMKIKLAYVLNFIFFLVFLNHIFQIGQKLNSPEYPSVTVYKKDLKEIAFPISFKLCANELKNSSERYKRNGYSNFYDFFRGKVMFGDRYFGWNGHAQNRTNLKTVQGTYRKYRMFNNSL